MGDLSCRKQIEFVIRKSVTRGVKSSALRGKIPTCPSEKTTAKSNRAPLRKEPIMSKPGRKTTPTKIQEIRGNPGKRALKPELKFDGLTRCPSWLTEAAKVEWRRLAPHLEALGLLTAADRAGFAAYCSAYAEWKRADEELQKGGETIEFQTKTGKYTQQSPWVTIRRRARADTVKIASEFGMTPSSRQSVGGAAEDAEAQKHLKFLRLD